MWDICILKYDLALKIDKLSDFKNREFRSDISQMIKDKLSMISFIYDVYRKTNKCIKSNNTLLE